MMKVAAFVIGAVGTNSYLVWDETSKDAMIVDPAGYDSRIDKMISDNALALKYIVLTHGHGDHIGGVPKYTSSYPDVKRVAGMAEREIFADPYKNHSMEITGESIGFVPELLLKDGDTFSLGDLVFEIIETPGHTPGGISIYTANSDESIPGSPYSGVLFSGDTLFRASVGRTDLFGGDTATLLSTIKKKLFSLPDDTVVFPGHMSYTTIEFEKNNNPFVNAY